MAEKSSWDQANRQQKRGLVWRNRKKISQIIKDYFCLPFFLLIILWVRSRVRTNQKTCRIVLENNAANPISFCHEKHGFWKRGPLTQQVPRNFFRIFQPFFSLVLPRTPKKRIRKKIFFLKAGSTLFKYG
jgi:hypothetical protein